MVFNKKFIAGMILIGVFAHVGAMKRPPEDPVSPNKRQKVVGELLVPAAPQKKKPQRIFVIPTTRSPMAGRYKAMLEAQARKDEIVNAIATSNFDATIGFLSNYSADVDNQIIGIIFNSGFSQAQQMQLYQQLKRDGKANVCGYKDPLSGKNIFHIFAEKDYPDLFYTALLDCPNAKQLVKATDDDKGNTVIHLTNNPAIIAESIRLGVDINEKNKAGNAALHEVAGGSSYEKQKAAVLVGLGASLDVLNKQGNNPYEYGGAKNEGLNPDNPEAVASETKKAISFGSGPHKKDIFPYVFGRSTGVKTMPMIARPDQNLWESEVSISDDESSDYGDNTSSNEDE